MVLDEDRRSRAGTEWECGKKDKRSRAVDGLEDLRQQAMWRELYRILLGTLILSGC